MFNQFTATEIMHAITSQLLEKEPEFLDLVEVFVQRLPATIANIGRLFDERKWPQLRKEVHELKGMGGGFGYPVLTELAAKIESQIAAENQDAVKSLLLELDGVRDCIVLGMSGTKRHCA